MHGLLGGNNSSVWWSNSDWHGRQGRVISSNLAISIHEACQACCWNPRRHFTGEFTLKQGHTGRIQSNDEGRGDWEEWLRITPNNSGLFFPFSSTACGAENLPGSYSLVLHGCLPIGVPLRMVKYTHRLTHICLRVDTHHWPHTSAMKPLDQSHTANL